MTGSNGARGRTHQRSHRAVSLNWQVAATALLIGIGNGMLHWQGVDRPWLDVQAQEHASIIAGTFFAPDQYRILTYALAEGLMRLGLPIHSAHEVWRVAFTSASLYVLYRYLLGWFSPLAALTGFFVAAAAIPLTYVYYMMQVTDPLNMLVFFLAFWAMREERDRWLLPLVLVGMLNRESPAIIPVFYAAVRWGRPIRAWLPWCVLLCLAAAFVYFGLRLAIGPKPPTGAYAAGPVHNLLVNFTDWRAYVDVLGVLNMSLWGAWIGWRRRPQFLRRTLLVAPLFVIPYLMFGTVRESRYYLPLLAIVVPLLLFYLQERTSAASSAPVDGPARFANEPATPAVAVETA